MANVSTLTNRYPVLYLNYSDGEWVVLASSGVLDPIQQLASGLTLDSAVENAIKDTKCQIRRKPVAGIVARAFAQLEEWLAPSPETRPAAVNALKRQTQLLERMMKPKKGTPRAKNPSSRIF
jgi:hypothetical protein